MTSRRPVTPRRTQAERVESMRIRLLDATLDLLASRGWANVSTNDVVRRAHVSRGALAHHFRTKAELMQAAANRLIDLRTADFETTFLALEPNERTVDRALDVLWTYFQGPSFAALLEMMVAARSNPDLRQVLSDAPDRIVEAAYGVFADVFPDVAAAPMGRRGLRAAVSLMIGMGVQQLVDDDHAGHHAELLGWLKTMAKTVLPISESGHAAARAADRS